MSASDILVLVGQVVQIVASFILSVEVIGLDRVEGWAKRLSLLHKDLRDLADDKGTRAHERPSVTLGRGIPGIIVSLAAAAGALGGHYVVRRFYPIPKFSDLRQDLLIFAVSIVAGVFGIVLWQTTVYGLRAAIWGLRDLQSRSMARTSGILGFLLLLVGFVLQFVGTIGQSHFK